MECCLDPDAIIEDTARGGGPLACQHCFEHPCCMRLFFFFTIKYAPVKVSPCWDGTIERPPVTATAAAGAQSPTVSQSHLSTAPGS